MLCVTKAHQITNTGDESKNTTVMLYYNRVHRPSNFQNIQTPESV